MQNINHTRRRISADIRYILCSSSNLFFFFKDTATPEIYTLSLHDALPICSLLRRSQIRTLVSSPTVIATGRPSTDRKSTRLNSNHVEISYAVFCLKKKKSIEPSVDRVVSRIHSAAGRIQARGAIGLELKTHDSKLTTRESGVGIRHSARSSEAGR